MKLRFTGKINFMEYHSLLADFVDGETKDVPDKIAEHLLGDFPGFFEEVIAKSIDEPVKHRMITNETKTKKTTARKRARR